jgi:16S rRNA pseudouridine516 synthase
LDQLLTARGYGSRREVMALLREGMVKVNGAVPHGGATKVNLESDSVTVRGQPVALAAFVTLMLHKPPGVISASSDPRAATVLDLLPPSLRRPGLFPVGRLDKDSTGLLLITNDGALAHALLSPRRHVPKTYRVTLRRAASPADVEAFAGGLRLPPADGHPPEDCQPAALFLLPNNQARVVLHEGKYHQIKRMFTQLGNDVLQLHREAMGQLHLDETLAPGESRLLTSTELLSLRAL